MQYSEFGGDNTVSEIQLPVAPAATPPRKAKEQTSILAAIATMLPAGLDFLDLSDDGFSELGERVAAKSVRRGFFHTLPTAVDFAGIDVVSLCGALEGDRDAAALLSAAATAGVPAICYVSCREFLDNAGDGLYRYSIDEFEAEAQAAGMAVALRLLFGKGAIYLLTPMQASGDAWWLRRDAAALIRRHRIRGERQLAKFRQNQTNGNWEFASEQWHKRAILAATLIPAGSAIMDVGCGAMYLEQTSKPRFYLPIDIGERDGRTRILNLNRQDIPLPWYDEVEIVACLGVFEYLEAPERIIAGAAARGRPMLISYNFKDIEDKGTFRKRGSSFSLDEIEAIFAEHGFSIVTRLPFGGRQMIWYIEPAR